MFHVFQLRPWKRTYATACVAAAIARHDVRRARARRVDRDVREPVPLEERERVGALVLGHPRAVPELDQRDERVEQRPRRARELVERLARLLDARVVLEQDAAQLPDELERRERVAELGERALARSVSSWPVIAPHAFAWKTKPAGVRSAHRAAVSGVGRR